VIAPATIPAPNVWHNGRAGRVVPPLFDDFEAAMDRPRLVLAALLFCPTIADRHLHRIDADFWSGAVQRALAAIALRQYRDDGEPDYIHAGIDAGDIGHDRRAVAAELELLADFAVIVRADNFIGDLAVLESRLADERFGDAFNEAALDLEHGAPIAAARMRITDALAAAQPPGPAVLTLADAMAADDGTHRELIRTGLAFVDDRFPGSGLCRGDKVGIASIPGGGKSAMALHVSLSALIYNPEMRCVWALGEMSTATLASRALTVLSRVPEGIRRDGRMTADEAERVRQAENALEELASRRPRRPRRTTSQVSG